MRIQLTANRALKIAISQETKKNKLTRAQKNASVKPDHRVSTVEA